MVFGAKDPKAGAVVSNFGIGTDNTLNHTVEYTGGVFEEECGKILSEFFERLRK